MSNKTLKAITSKGKYTYLTKDRGKKIEVFYNNYYKSIGFCNTETEVFTIIEHHAQQFGKVKRIDYV